MVRDHFEVISSIHIFNVVNLMQMMCNVTLYEVLLVTYSIGAVCYSWHRCVVELLFSGQPVKLNHIDFQICHMTHCDHRLPFFLLSVNVGCGPAEERVLLTGLHAVADIYCENCKTTLGWKYVSLHFYSCKILSAFC